MPRPPFYRPSSDHVARARKLYPKAFMAWTPEEDRTLHEAVKSGMALVDLIATFKRSPRSILMRIELYGLHLAGEATLTPPPYTKEPVLDDPKANWPKEAQEAQEAAQAALRADEPAGGDVRPTQDDSGRPRGSEAL